MRLLRRHRRQRAGVCDLMKWEWDNQLTDTGGTRRSVNIRGKIQTFFFFLFPFFVSVVPDQRGGTPAGGQLKVTRSNLVIPTVLFSNENTERLHEGSVWVRCRSILHSRNEINKVNVT